MQMKMRKSFICHRLSSSIRINCMLMIEADLNPVKDIDLDAVL